MKRGTERIRNAHRLPRAVHEPSLGRLSTAPDMALLPFFQPRFAR